MNKSFFDNEWYDHTTLHPMGLVAIVVLGLLLLVVQRRYSFWPILVMACFVAPAQRIVVAGLDFNLLRVMVLFGWIRVASRVEWVGFRMTTMDWLIVAWAVSGTAAYSILNGTAAAFIYKLGSSFDAVGMYFLCRMLVRDWTDVRTLATGIALTAVPVAIAFLIERSTGRNAFAFFGGVPELTVVREGKLRAQGAFAHPILAGTFWAALVPMILIGWHGGTVRRLVTLGGIAASLVIVVACASSTPVAAVAAASLGICMFPVRRHMRIIRWGLVGVLAALHMAMKAPVWHLVSRIDLVGGSTGWHRYYLIDQAIRRFPEWAVIGTHSTAHWGWGMFDVTNQYVLEGVRGGALTLTLFVAIIVIAFRDVGRAVVGERRARGRESAAWLLGVSLFVHIMAFIAVSYFGQIIVIWFMQLAVITNLAQARRVPTGLTTGRPITGRMPRGRAMQSLLRTNRRCTT